MRESLPREIKNILCDTFEGFELVEYLDISIEDIVDCFEDEILFNLEDVLEYINMINEEDDYENEE